MILETKYPPELSFNTVTGTMAIEEEGATQEAEKPENETITFSIQIVGGWVLRPRSYTCH